MSKNPHEYWTFLMLPLKRENTIILKYYKDNIQ